ncbi:MAG: 2-oxoglutarate dehydrogenase complex dihydrolipoyllysine-residue succinyltransferase, partial [Cyclobacteriaceae bacterium]|nr:2-oxoglutarate dehydrogenase complex dihydrolipoyllysine-residue succinyltransferase [Cyclobacteriaceae bacterium]
MGLEIKVPAVGESITEVTVGQWLKQDGDYVEVDEIICELESDKASFELNAEVAGILKTKAQEGDTLEIGAVICEIDAQEAPATTDPVAVESASEEVAPSSTPAGSGDIIEMRVPEVGESITEVVIGAWLKNDGDQVALDETIADIESDKASFELPAEGTGILRIVAQEGDTLEIGALICKIELREEGIPSTSAPAPNAPTAEAPVSSGTGYAQGHPSPAAAKILAEKNMDPAQVAGSGVDGRITKEDAVKATPAAKEASQVSVTPAGERGQRREKMTSLRKTIAKRLVASKNETAMLTTFNEVDMHPIMEIRRKYKEQFKEKKEVGLGFMSFFTKAVCLALQEWPSVNAMIDGEEMVFNDYCDISIAVSSPKGLVVPVIRNAETLNFEQIEKEVVRLARKARDGKLSIEEMTGGTFTITNGGIFGSMLSTPIINQPQSAILGMHNIVSRPVAVNGEVVIRPVMYVALSYDH